MERGSDEMVLGAGAGNAEQGWGSAGESLMCWRG